MSRFDVIAFKTRNGKTYAVKLGSAVPRKEGGGFICYLDALPTPDLQSGQFIFSIMPPREKPDARQAAEREAEF